MSEFQNRRKMFEPSSAPPIKLKPVRKTSDSQQKVATSPTVSTANEEHTAEHIEFNDNIDSSKSITSPDVHSNNETFNFCNSVYDLPGFEHYLFESAAQESPLERVVSGSRRDCSEEQQQQQHQDNTIVITTDTEIDSAKLIEDIQLAPSPHLIEEIFNTAIWRNSNNFSDDFIFAPPKMSVASNISEDVATPTVTEVDPKKAQTPGRRSLFGSFFKSKRGQKKSSDKLAGKDNSDTDSLQDSPHKAKSSAKNALEDDSGSLDTTPTKPLNSIFNRDWLNTIGDGIKKKASVMSELKKVFSHGKFKHFKKKTSKNGSVASTEKKKPPNRQFVIEEDIYDDDVEEEEEEKEMDDATERREKDHVLSKRKNKKCDSIYDDEDEEPSAMEECMLPSGDIVEAKNIKRQEHPHSSGHEKCVDEVYVSDAEEIGISTSSITVFTKTQISKDLEDEDIYDNGGDDEEIETIEKKVIKNTESIKKVKILGNILAKKRLKGTKEHTSSSKCSTNEKNQEPNDGPKDNKDIKGCGQNKFKKNLNVIMSMKVERSTDIYDVDEEVVEEYVSDSESENSVNDKRRTTKDLEDKRVAQRNGMTSVNQGEMTITTSKDKPSDLYDEDNMDNKVDLNTLRSLGNERGKTVKCAKNTLELVKKNYASKRPSDQNVCEKKRAKEKTLQDSVYDEDNDTIEVYASDYEGEEETEKLFVVGARVNILPETSTKTMKATNIIKEASQQSKIYVKNEEQIEEYFSDVDDVGAAEENLVNEESKEDKQSNSSKTKPVMLKHRSEVNSQYDQECEMEDQEIGKTSDDPIPCKTENDPKKASTNRQMIQPKKSKEPKSSKNKSFFKKTSKNSDLYDEDVDVIEEYDSGESMYDNDDADLVDEEKSVADVTHQTKKISNNSDEKVKSKKDKGKFLSNFLHKPISRNQDRHLVGVVEAIGSDHSVGPLVGTQKTSSESREGKPGEVYDEDYDFIKPEDHTHRSKKAKPKNDVNEKKTIPKVISSRKEKEQLENILVEGKKKSNSEVNAAIGKNNKAPLKGDEYDEDDEEPFNLSKSIEEIQIRVFDFETEDEALRKVIKKNLNMARKMFKLKDPVLPVATARAIKTVYSEGKLQMNFNVGEILEVLEYRDNQVLVRNGVGKCGLTSTSNLEVSNRRS